MSVLDKAVAALTPPESDEARAEARREAQAAATPGGWLATILDHHRQIEACFDAVKSATDAGSRRAAQKKLGIILTGHAIAEEAVLYPSMIECGEKAHAGMAYTEQAAAKTQLAMLDNIDPMSQDYDDKLEHLRGAVAHHMYEEEGTWFLELSRDPDADQAMLAERYNEQWSRYVRGDADRAPSAASDRGAVMA